MTMAIPALRAALAAALLSLMSAAHGAIPAQQLEAYKQMCVSTATSMPKPYGEWDLKGHPKLGKYCECFAPLFAARAMKAAEFMQKNPGKPLPASLDESNKDELAMRNTCRKQLGLPLAVAP